MTDGTERFETLREIVDAIDPMQMNADWGREFARAVYDTDDEELIVYVLADAGESYRSSQLSKLRKRSRTASRGLAATTNGHRAEALYTQMDMPIVVPGLPPIPLRDATHLFLVPACAALERQIGGSLQNLALMERARDASEPWPETSIGTLIDSGAITAESLSIEREA
ncbi:MAG: hypothetical protein ACR2OO_16755 [Thermomicrobiales bacterium]